jgi:hypothetical protein
MFSPHPSHAVTLILTTMPGLLGFQQMQRTYFPPKLRM